MVAAAELLISDDSLPENEVLVEELNHLDIPALGTEVELIASFLTEIKDLIETRSGLSIASDSQRGRQLKEPLPLLNRSKANYIVYVDPTARTFLSQDKAIQNPLFIGDVYQIVYDTIEWFETFYQDRADIREALTDSLVQQNFIDREKNTSEKGVSISETKLFDLRPELLKQINALLQILSLLNPQIEVSPTDQAFLAAINDVVQKPSFDWSGGQNLWLESDGLKDQTKALIDKTNTISYQVILEALTVFISGLRGLVFSTDVLKAASDTLQIALTILTDGKAKFLTLDPSINDKDLTELISFFDDLFIQINDKAEPESDRQEVFGGGGQESQSRRKAEPGETANLPSPETLSKLSKERLAALTPGQRSLVEYQHLSLQAAFLQNQIAVQFFTLYGIPGPDAVFSQFPPLLQYQLRRAILNELFSLNPELLTGANRFKLGHDIFERIIRQNPGLLLQTQLFLLQYAQQQTNRPELEKTLSVIQQDINNLQHPSPETLTQYSNHLYQNFRGDENFEKVAVDSEFLVRNGFFQHGLATQGKEFTQSLSAFKIEAHEALNLQVFIHSGIASHHDPEPFLYTYLFQFRDRLSTREQRDLFQTSVHYWLSQRTTLANTIFKPKLNEVVDELPPEEVATSFLAEDPILAMQAGETTSLPDVTTSGTTPTNTTPSFLNKVASFINEERSQQTTVPDDLDGFLLAISEHHARAELLKEQVKNNIVDKILLPWVAEHQQSAKWVLAKYDQVSDQKLIEAKLSAFIQEHPEAAKWALGKYDQLVSLNQSVTQSAHKQAQAVLTAPQFKSFSQKVATVTRPPTAISQAPAEDAPLLQKLVYRLPISERWRIAHETYLEALQKVSPYEVVEEISAAQPESTAEESLSSQPSQEIQETFRSSTRSITQPLSQPEGQQPISLKNIDNLTSTLSRARTTKTALSKSQLLSKTLLRAKKTFDDAKMAMNIGKALSMVQATISTMISTAVTALGAVGGAVAGIVGITSLPALAAAAVGGVVVGGLAFLGSKIIQSLSTPTITAGQGIAPTLSPSGSAPPQVTPTNLLARSRAAVAQLTTPTGLAMSGIGLGGGVIVIGNMVTHGAFLNPLGTIDGSGEFSQYVEILKKPSVTKVEVDRLPTDVEYTITIRPKTGYSIKIKNVTDTMSFRFASDSDRTKANVVRGLDQLAPLQEGQVIAAGTEIVIIYSENFDVDLIDSSVKNTFKLDFEYTATDGETGSDTASTFSTICVGECPKQGEGCWPVTARLMQGPGGIPNGYVGFESSHGSPEFPLEAIDFAAAEGTPIYSPYAGTAHVFPEGSGGGWTCRAGRFNSDCYGNHVVLNTNQGFILGFAHMSSITLSQTPGAEVQVNEGDQVGTVGNTGLGYAAGEGTHLHYEVRSEKMINIVPGPLELGEVTTCYE